MFPTSLCKTPALMIDDGEVSLHAGSVSVVNYNMAALSGPVQIGDGNVMYVSGSAASRHHQVPRQSSLSSSSSRGARTHHRHSLRPKKQINGNS